LDLQVHERQSTQENLTLTPRHIRWLENPEALIRGQKMGYSVPNPQDRLDMIAYLKSVPVKP